MDIEFIVQDVFALTRPQWKLASNFEEASKAFKLAVAQDQKTSGTDKIAEPEEPDSDGASDDGMGDNDAEAEAEAEAGLLEADADEESDSEEDIDVSFQWGNYQKHYSLTYQIDANGDHSHSQPVSDSEEEEIVVTRQEEEIDPEDEADFEREYAKMMAESLESRKHERKSTFDVPLPMKRKEVTTTIEPWTDEPVNNSAAPPGTMAFSLLTKRGNRQQVEVHYLWSTPAD
jgi:regulator of nonsense transcripts 2